MSTARHPGGVQGPGRGARAPGGATLRRRGRRTLRWAGASLSVDRRAVIVSALLAAAILVVGVLALGLGDIALGPAEVASALLGTADDRTTLVVLGWRLPRILLALSIGAALAVSGAIFQTLTRNPLGSPDVIGFASGSYTGALVAIITVGGGYASAAAGSLVGGVATALVVWTLTLGRGTRGVALIVVGIGVSALLGAVNTWLVLTADLQVAMTAAVWGAGSLNGLGTEELTPVGIGVLLLLAAATATAPRLRMLELGDDAARALGAASARYEFCLLLLGVALTALATAAAGPIAFIALAAPQIARRLTRSGSTGVVSSALLGALVLLVADTAAQHLVPGVQLPVGVVTVVVGGCYLIWLLVHEARRG
ncbi:FecCD family ABC transporter permease [Mycetocola reblochoni]|uniref:FecCD family ABC transporter permease n=1 Tax=Mycetocola reblochoni TaxID=331618 RepID=UPI001C4E50FA|nr:iron chelate uptake ABC transporter family permease subunit [Mycetocola reblochoni]